MALCYPLGAPTIRGEAQKSCLKLPLRVVEVTNTSVAGGALEESDTAYSSLDPPDFRMDVTVNGLAAPKVHFSILALSYPKGILGIRCEIWQYDKDWVHRNMVKQMSTGWISPATDLAGNKVWQSIVEVSSMGGEPLVLDLEHTNVFYPLKLVVYAVEPTGSSMVVEAEYAKFDPNDFGNWG